MNSSCVERGGVGFAHTAFAGGDEPLLPGGEFEKRWLEYVHETDTERRAHLREGWILYHQRLVRSLASRFLGTGESLDDLIQVGNIGLINALDRFDPLQGNRFSTYATPTILGEIRRYFRDKAHTIKVPRWLQEMQHGIRTANPKLTHELGRAPTPAEVAAYLGASEEDVLRALQSNEATNILSLDSSFEGLYGGGTASLQDLLGQRDKTLREIEDFGDLRAALQALSVREMEVISLRFFEDLSQASIAQRLNISQMHVSRLQKRALKRLREHLSETPAALIGRRRNRRDSTLREVGQERIG